MNHLDFLETAEKLITTKNPTEADIRSAVSRAYYAVYHHALSWWKSHNFPDYRDRGHTKIQMALFNAGISDVRDFSREMSTLNRDRRKADYQLANQFNLRSGRATLERARSTIAVFDALDKVALEAGVKNYLRRTHQS